jgi:hypothetical protein
MCVLGVHGSVLRNIKLIERTNKMQPCSRLLERLHEIVLKNSRHLNSVTLVNKCVLDVHGSVHRYIKLIERTNKMQPCNRI